MADVSARNITPLADGVPAEGLEYADTLLHFGQLFPLGFRGRLVLCGLLWVLALWPCLQPNDPPSQEVGINSVTSDAGPDLVEAALESMESGKSNVLARCGRALDLVLDGGVLAENMAVANVEDLGARGAVLVLVFMEEQCDTTLSIIVPPLHSSNRHAGRSSEETTDIVGGVIVVGDAQKGWTQQLH